MSFVKDTLTVQGVEIGTSTGFVKQARLRFFQENPRIYSVIMSGDANPSQEYIQERLLRLDHVKHLVQDIRKNGGLIDPLIVRAGDYVVLEGNSRLAAYRALAERDALRWGLVKCTLLPENIDERYVFALLGQYHIKGKKDWAPYEQAGFLYRRHKQHHVPISLLAQELGVSNQKIRRLIDTFEFMLDHDENRLNRWSYYEEYVRSRKIKKLRNEYAEFDDVVVKLVRSGKIARAVDVREKVPLLEAAKKRTVRKFLRGELDLEAAVDAALASGGTGHVYKKLHRFRMWLAQEETEKAVSSAQGPAKDKITYELKKIYRGSKKLGGGR